jgi:hypothetical protein
MALLTRGLEGLGQPAAPPLSNESTRWLDQCRCCKFQSFSHDIIGAGRRDRRQLIIAAERAAARSVTF